MRVTIADGWETIADRSGVEIAARGTEGRIYPWGSAHPTRGHANAGETRWRGYNTLSNVGRFELGKTPEGVYDLAGNLWEWVADWYDPTYYQFSARDKLKGPSAGHLLWRRLEQ